MPFSIGFLDNGRVLEWEATADGAVATDRDDYTPRFYVAARDPATDLDLTTLQSVYDLHPDVVATDTVTRRPSFRETKRSSSLLRSHISTTSSHSPVRHGSCQTIQSGSSPDMDLSENVAVHRQYILDSNLVNALLLFVQRCKPVISDVRLIQLC